MKTITDSLKNFYAKLGGNPSNLPSRSTSADIIDAMSDVYTDKEGTHVEVTTQVTEGTKIATIKTNNEDHDIYAPTELPSVTSSDEGKVLSVNSSGAWVAANAGGGGSGATILDCEEVQVESETRLVLPDNITVNDIIRRLQTGEFIILRHSNNFGLDGTYFYAEHFYEWEDSSELVYSGSSYNDDNSSYIRVAKSVERENDYLIVTSLRLTIAQ